MNKVNTDLVWFVKKKIDGKWKPLLLLMIHKLPMRFNKIKQLLPDISSRVLTKNLKELENDQLINKDEITSKFCITQKGINVCKHIREIVFILSE